MDIKKRRLDIKNALLMIFLIVLVGLSFIIPNYSFAAGGFGGDVASLAVADAALTTLYIATGGVALIGLYQIKLVVIVVGWLLQVLGAAVINDFGIEGVIFSGSGKYENSLVSINIFKNIGKGTTLGAFSDAVAKWYYILRFIAAACLLAILIYVGIRMALATVGKDQAKYKEWLINWLVSLALLFMLDYIIVVTFTINDALVETILALEGKDVITTAEMMGVLSAESALPGFIGILACACFAALSLQIFSFIFMYIKRLITVSFLIMISPLICITYSIDKIGDGRSQALNEWLKQFIYNVLIQPFHCIIYVSLLTTAFDVGAGRVISTSGYILSIVILFFMKSAEKILRQIFHFHQGVGGLGEAGQAMMNATGKVAAVGAAAGTGIINFKNSGGFDKMKSNLDFKARKQTTQDFKNNFQSANGKKASLTDTMKYKFSSAYNSDIQEHHKENVRQRRDKIDEKKYNKFTQKDKKGKHKTYDEEKKGAAREVEEEIKKENAAKKADEKFKSKHGGKSKEEYINEVQNGSDSQEIKKKKIERANNEYEKYKSDAEFSGDANVTNEQRKSSEYKKRVSDRTHENLTKSMADSQFIGIGGHGTVIKKPRILKAGKNYRQYAKDIGMDKFSTSMAVTGIASMAGLAFAGGQGSMQGFYTGYQAVSGLMKPILKDSASTMEQDGATRIAKVRECCPELAGLSEEQIMKYLKSLDETGLRDSIGNKKLDIKDLASDIASKTGRDLDDVKRDLNSFIGELQTMLQNDKIGSFNVEEVAKKLAREKNLGEFNGDFKDNTLELCNNLAMLNGKQQVAQAESLGYTISHYAEKCSEKRQDSSRFGKFENIVDYEGDYPVVMTRGVDNDIKLDFTTGSGSEITLNFTNDALLDAGINDIDMNLLLYDSRIKEILESGVVDEDELREAVLNSQK